MNGPTESTLGRAVPTVSECVYNEVSIAKQKLQNDWAHLVFPRERMGSEGKD